MILLAIEASASLCSVGLWCDGEISERNSDAPRAHTRSLLAFVDELLRSRQLTVSDCDALVFSAGPGSFTGVRLAAAVAKSLGYAAGKPVLGISSLAAMAQAACQASPAHDSCLVVTDARMGEYYLGRYRCSAGVLLAEAADCLQAPAQLDTLVPGQALIVHDGNDWALQQQAAGCPALAVQASARHLLQLAAGQLADGLPPAASALSVQVNYLRGRSSWKTVEQQQANH